MNLSLDPKILTVSLSQGGVSVEYELREMVASERDQYMDEVGDRLRLDASGKPAGVKKFEGMQSSLLSRCLFVKATNEKVTKPVIQSWPGSVVGSLFTEAQKLNGLGVDEAPTPAAAKND